MNEALCCTVASFVPFDIAVDMPGLFPGRYRIPASDTKIPTTIKIETAVHFVYMNESQGSLQVKNPPDVVARAIVEDYVNSQLALNETSGPALFWLTGDVEVSDILTKHKTMITKLKERQRNWFLNIVRMTDDDWRKYQRHTVISNFNRTIGSLMTLNPEEHPWMQQIKTLEDAYKPCQFCMSNISKEASVCSVCGHVVDVKRHKELESAQKG